MKRENNSQVINDLAIRYQTAENWNERDEIASQLYEELVFLRWWLFQKWQSYSYEDNLSVFGLAVAIALDSFNSEKSKFTTHLVRVFGHERARDYEKSQHKKRGGVGIHASQEEKDEWKLRRNSLEVSIQAFTDDDGDEYEPDFMGDGEQDFAATDDGMMAEYILSTASELLKPREYQAFYKTIYEGKTLRVAAAEMGMSYEGVRDNRARAIRRLKHKIGSL